MHAGRERPQIAADGGEVENKIGWNGCAVFFSGADGKNCVGGCSSMLGSEEGSRPWGTVVWEI